MRVLATAASCSCCGSLHRHIFLRLGSTLFLDDDPHRLMQVFTPAERAFITPQALAAYIVLTGRERVELFPTNPPRNWPAFDLLATVPR